MKLLTFDEFINEDFDSSFTQIGIAPEGNVSGMGAIAPPSTSSTGSGDTWTSLSQPYSFIHLRSQKRKKKRKKKVE